MHQRAVALAATGDHVHVHEHGDVRHFRRHHREVFIRKRAAAIAEHSSQGNLLGRLSAIAVPFGVAASPDLRFLPIVIRASAYGVATVGPVLAVFGTVTLVAFAGSTLIQRSGHRLTECDASEHVLAVDPFAVFDEIPLHIADGRDRAAKAPGAKAEEVNEVAPGIDVSRPPDCAARVDSRLSVTLCRPVCWPDSRHRARRRRQSRA